MYIAHRGSVYNKFVRGWVGIILFIMAYICVYFACMEHTFIVVLLECFVELYFFIQKGVIWAVYKSY